MNQNRFEILTHHEDDNTLIPRRNIIDDVPREVMILIVISLIVINPESVMTLLITHKFFLKLLDGTTYRLLIEALVSQTNQMNSRRKEEFSAFKRLITITEIPSYRYLKIFNSEYWVNCYNYSNRSDFFSLFETTRYCLSDNHLEIFIDALITKKQHVAEFLASVMQSSVDYRNIVKILQKKCYTYALKKKKWYTGHSEFDKFIDECNNVSLRDKIFNSNVDITLSSGLIVLIMLLPSDWNFSTQVINMMIESRTPVNCGYYFYKYETDALFKTSYKQRSYHSDNNLEDSYFDDETIENSYGSLQEFISNRCASSECVVAMNRYIEKFHPRR